MIKPVHKSLEISFLAQLISKTLLNLPEQGIINRILAKLLSRVRSRCIRWCDPLISYNLQGFQIILPLSHELPFYRKAFPRYALNAGEIAQRVQSKYPDLRVIDIGANVGDTLAVFRSLARFPILCIEGNARYYAILEKNLEVLGGEVYGEESFIGSDTGTLPGDLIEAGGTAFFDPKAAPPEALAVSRLSDVLDRQPLFRAAKMLKIDTDGFDCGILLSERDFLGKIKPVIFFEYAPDAAARCGIDCFSVFEMLKNINYTSIMVYDNFGNYHLMAALENRRILEDIHHYYSGCNSKRYADIVAFHEEDEDLCQTIRLAELKYIVDNEIVQ
jgi:FkbM family methyltransferase